MSSETTAWPTRAFARMFCFTALTLVLLSCASKPTTPQATTGNYTPAGHGSRANEVSQKNNVPGPWLLLKSIGFFQDQADLPSWESIKITEIVTYVSQHPGVEIGINRLFAQDDPKIAGLNHSRIRTIIDTMIVAGVSADKILIGDYGELSLPSDQQVEVFVRRRP